MATKKLTDEPAPTAPTATTPTGARRYTLDEVVALGNGADERFRKVIFKSVKETTLLSRGQRIHTQNILDDIPSFFFDFRAIAEGLSPAQRKRVVGYSPRLDAVLAAEVGKLAKMQAAHSVQSQSGNLSRAVAKAAAAEAWTAGMDLRDQAAGIVGRLAGDGEEDQVEVRERKGTAETEADLAAGLNGIATLIENLRAGDDDTRVVLDDLLLTAEYVADLRAAATRVVETAKVVAAAAPEARVSKRQLDVQDGTVLHVVEIIYKAFRAARNRDETILLPRLGSMQPLIDRVRQGGKSAPAGDATAPAEPTETP